MENSLFPNHKDPPGIVTQKIKLNWKHCWNCRHLWICLDISLTCEGDIVRFVKVGKKEKQHRTRQSDTSQTLVQPWDKREERAYFLFRQSLKEAGSSRRKALLSDSSCSSGSRLCPPIPEKQLCVGKAKVHPKLLLLVKKERWFNSCLDLSGQYDFFTCIVLNMYMHLNFSWGIYFTVMPKESASGTMWMQWQRTKAYLLVLGRIAIS